MALPCIALSAIPPTTFAAAPALVDVNKLAPFVKPAAPPTIAPLRAEPPTAFQLLIFPYFRYCCHASYPPPITVPIPAPIPAAAKFCFPLGSVYKIGF